ncbi:helix-turn-helix transcriptional regulator [Candidatus Margulisiibacteriota bacterium]
MSVYGMSDKAILREIGQRLKRKRLVKNLTQQSLADIVGLNRMTISEIENGNIACNMITLIQVLRALDLLNEFNVFLSEPQISPLQLARLKGKERQRASRRKNINNG